MHILISFVAALVALYYLGKMADTYNADPTYITPLVTLLIYSIVSIVRDLKKSYNYWFGDDYYDDYHYNPPYQNNNSYSTNRWSNRTIQDFSFNSVKNETVEYYTPNKEEEKTYDKELIHYTSNSEIREKLKELEKSKWFRLKRSFFSLFGIDLNEKYTNKFKKPIKTTCKIVPLQNKEDDSRFMPKLTYAQEQELQEYNSVVKHIGRSCEIAFDKNILKDDK